MLSEDIIYGNLDTGGSWDVKLDVGYGVEGIGVILMQAEVQGNCF